MNAHVPYIPPYITDNAAAIVDAIVTDLTGRKGLDNEWEQIDEDIQRDIVAQWVQLAVEVLTKPRECFAVGDLPTPYLPPVKALVWTEVRCAEYGSMGYCCDLGCGRYYRIYPPRGACTTWLLGTESMDTEDPSHPSSWHPTLEAAQAAAQQEWGAFITAAIQS